MYYALILSPFLCKISILALKNRGLDNCAIEELEFRAQNYELIAKKLSNIIVNVDDNSA